MRSVTRAVAAIGVVLGVSTAPGSASAQRVLEVEYTPTRRAQIAVWVTSADGTYLETLALTESVARYGLGNRPGALQMNSGFRWPYGRREGVLPIWAHARASAPGAALFPRVVFQDRVSEGWASRSNPTDYSPDDHFCLAFRGDSSREGLDAVTCPSQFMSDKGRYLTLDDVAGEYREPMESAPGVPGSWTLDLFSLYPPRRDVTRCMRPGCFDHADVDRYQADARAVMPELDAVSTATPPGDTTQHLMLAVPDAWEDGTYHLFLEINVEGDYAPSWDADRFPTPRTDPSRPMREQWDMYAEQYGYPYRGQPSIVFRATVEVGSTSVVEVREPAGYGSIDGRGPRGGEITSMDGSILEDPSAPGSGVDRLRADAAGTRLRVSRASPSRSTTIVTRLTATRTSSSSRRRTTTASCSTTCASRTCPSPTTRASSPRGRPTARASRSRRCACRSMPRPAASSRSISAGSPSSATTGSARERATRATRARRSPSWSTRHRRSSSPRSRPASSRRPPTARRWPTRSRS
jgi:hypothetical protein